MGLDAIVPIEIIEKKILLIRGQKVMLDRELAELYDVTTGNLNKAVSRNIERFPDDFMFRLTKKEYDSLRFQFGILKRGEHSKYFPRAFTQEGIAMLSGVLKSDRAVHVNIAIMRVFVRLREMLSSNKELARKLDALENKYDAQFKAVFDAIRQLMTPPEKKKEEDRILSRDSRVLIVEAHFFSIFHDFYRFSSIPVQTGIQT